MGFMPLINDTETTTISDLIFLIFKVHINDYGVSNECPSSYILPKF